MTEEPTEPRGIITEVGRFSTHDGPGIRTTVFFKGCPLRCSWCSNPETLRTTPELYLFPERCHGFGACVESCAAGALCSDGRVLLDRQKCDACMRCVPACPHRALRTVGRETSCDALLADMAADRPFYGRSGGATLSGGEPLWQAELALSLLGACREAGIGTVLDTSGFAPAAVARRAAELADLVLLDIKHMDGVAHAAEVGVDNRAILENAVRMAKRTRLRISLPLVPGFNDDEDNVRRTAELGRSIGAEAVDLNPMHRLGLGKYRALGLRSPYDRFAAVNLDHVRRLADVVRAVGLEVTVGRMM